MLAMAPKRFSGTSRSGHPLGEPLPRLARGLMGTVRRVGVTRSSMRREEEITMATALSEKEGALIDAYWRAA